MIRISTLVRTFALSLFFLFIFSLYAYAEDACPTLREYMDDGIGNNFILKEAYDIIARATSRVARFSWGHFAEPLQALVGLGTAIYIALYTLRNIGSFSQQDTAAYLSNEKTGVIPLAVKMLIVVWLLGNQSFIYEHLIGMALSTCMEIGDLVGSRSGIGKFSSPNSLDSLFFFVINKVIDFNNKIYKIVATGQLLFCMSFSPDSILDYYYRAMFFAAALWVYGWMIVIGVSFYMLDVLFRLGIGCIVLPFAIACGLSKLTVDYTRKTWNLFMNVGFNFIMLGVVIGFTYAMIEQCIGLDIPENRVLNEADMDQITEHLDFGGIVITALCSMVAFQLFMQLEVIVDKVSGTQSVGKVGAEVGAKLGNGVGRLGKAPAQALGQFAGAGVHVAGNDISRFANRMKRNVSNWVQGTSAYRALSASRVGRTYRATKRFLRW